jgi:hypothetical protein
LYCEQCGTTLSIPSPNLRRVQTYRLPCEANENMMTIKQCAA